MQPPVSIRWAPAPDGDVVRIIDQRVLPQQLLERDIRTLDEVCEAIRTLAVRGAPAIGAFSAMGLARVMQQHAAAPREAFDAALVQAARQIRATRPTAVNLPAALERMLACAAAAPGASLGAARALRAAADAIHAEDAAMCRRIGEQGRPLLGPRSRVLTHCNAGALATCGIGTALAPLYLAHEEGLPLHVYATETRPLLQGSRLTAWELTRAGIPTTLVIDSAAAPLMRAGAVHLVIVGADRIAANGDVANKIGTYALAVLAQHHGVPFYVAAPTSTIDPATPNGAAIAIEQRDADEVRAWRGVPAAPEGLAAHNPAFDVTPAALISGIITDRALHRPPYDFSVPAA
jgi:methylthioribose-1-phosphate isomerase